MLLSAAPPRHPRLSVPTLLLIPSIALLLAYLYALNNRPSIPDHVQVDDPGKYGFPSWYGPGWTPYDLADEKGEVNMESIDVLLFVDLPYDSPHTRQALSTLSALNSRPSTIVTVISPFSSSWNSSLGARNLEIAGCGQVIWRIGNHVRDLEGICSNSTIVSEILGPQNGPEHDVRANITILPQPQNLLVPHRSYEELSATYGEDWQMGLFSHILPAVSIVQIRDVRLLSDHRLRQIHPSTIPRTISAREVRSHISLHPQEYHLKWTLGSQWSVYRPSAKPRLRRGEDPFVTNSIYRRAWEREERKRCAAMRRAGICLFEGWQDGLLDIRMVQAMLSGCVVATVVPEIEHDLLAPLVLALPQPPEQEPLRLPVEAIKMVLSQESSSTLQSKALQAFIVARQKYVPAARIRSIFDALARWEEGGRGYLFPHGFRWSCQSAGEKPPWCSLS